MAERYDDPPGDAPLGDEGALAGGDGSYEWIGEWLCEYVDGTMDPSMQAVFEEYIEANPELAAHIERLCRTRSLLGSCECRDEASERVKERLRRAKQDGRLEQAGREIEEQVRDAIAAAPPSAADASPPGEEHSRKTRRLPALSSKAGTVAAVASAMTLMLGVGMVAGVSLFADAPSERPAAPPRIQQQAADRLPDRSALPPPRMTFGGTQAAGSWNAPPLPLKKMPVRTGDSARASHAPLQHTLMSP
jgi:ferric-dicitrate binding protein FerR (iron transport regulator)